MWYEIMWQQATRGKIVVQPDTMTKCLSLVRFFIFLLRFVVLSTLSRTHAAKLTRTARVELAASLCQFWWIFFVSLHFVSLAAWIKCAQKKIPYHRNFAVVRPLSANRSRCVLQFTLFTIYKKELITKEKKSSKTKTKNENKNILNFWRRTRRALENVDWRKHKENTKRSSDRQTADSEAKRKCASQTERERERAIRSDHDISGSEIIGEW